MLKQAHPPVRESSERTINRQLDDTQHEEDGQEQTERQLESNLACAVMLGKGFLEIHMVQER